ncbi:hypothetical protein [Candidatus Electronema sp. PJ]
MAAQQRYLTGMKTQAQNAEYRSFWAEFGSAVKESCRVAKEF